MVIETAGSSAPDHNAGQLTAMLFTATAQYMAHPMCARFAV